MRQGAVFVIQLLQLEMHLGVELARSGGNKFVDQIMKSIGLHDKAGRAEFRRQRVDHGRKFLRPR